VLYRQQAETKGPLTTCDRAKLKWADKPVNEIDDVAICNVVQEARHSRPQGRLESATEKPLST
jgi:hypothetical protein